MRRRPPRSTRTDTLFPYTTLFRSGLWPDGAVVQAVATVPPQHMYGMEMSVLLPLLGNVAVHVARPFFPQAVADALAEAKAPRLLVTDRQSTRLNPVTNAHLVCRLPLEKKK